MSLNMFLFLVMGVVVADIVVTYYLYRESNDMYEHLSAENASCREMVYRLSKRISDIECTMEQLKEKKVVRRRLKKDEGKNSKS